MSKATTSTPRVQRLVLWVFVAANVLAVLTAGVFSHRMLESREMAHWSGHREAMALQLANRCDAEIDAARRDLVALATMDAFQSLDHAAEIVPSLHGVPEGVDTEKRDLLDLLLSRGEKFSVLFVLQEDGTFYMAHPYEVQVGLNRPSLAERPYFQEAARRRRPVVSDSFYGADGVLAVAIDVPILDAGGEVVAHLGGVFHLRSLSRLVEGARLGPATSGFLVDRNGYLIAHTDVRLLKVGMRERYAAHPLVAEFLASESSPPAVLSRECVDPVDGRLYFTAFVPLASGWGLGLAREKASVLAEIRPEARRATVLVALLFLALSTVGVLIAQRLIRRWELAEHELAEHRRKLEEKVTARTAELSQANRRLQLEMRQREAAQKALRERDDQLRQAQKMEAIGTLAGGIAHDFNNLLTSIVGGIEMALLKLPASSPAVRYLKDAGEAVELTADLTQQLLTVSRRQEPVFSATDVGAVVEDTVRLLCRSIPETIRIETEIEAGLPRIRADRGQLEQAFLNLGINARDAMPEGGSLRFTVTSVQLDAEMSHPRFLPGRFLVVEVTDTGEGIPAEIRDRIFEPFFTTRPPGRGTGLGLAMVYNTAEAHGGWIQVESSEGRGTTVRLHLPQVPAEAEEPAASEVKERDVLPGSETLLLVDDAETVLTSGKAILEELGYAVLTAEDGADGLEVAERHRAEIALVVTDIVMPRAGGRFLLRELRHRGFTVPVVAASGYAEGMGTPELLAEGFAAFLAKPFRMRELARVIRRLLDAEGRAAS